MTASKRTARLVGIFYILATVAGIVGLSLSQPILDASDYLTQIADKETELLLGALFTLIMGVAVTGIALAIYPVLRTYNSSIAIGYVVARTVEAVIFVIDVLSMLLLITLSDEFIDAGSPGDSYFHTLGKLLLEVREWSGHVILDVAVFPLGALILYALLYQTNLVPRWLSGWGIIGAILSWSAGLLVIFDIITPLTTGHILLQAPVGIQEMVFAVWLLIKGFNSPAEVAPGGGGA